MALKRGLEIVFGTLVWLATGSPAGAERLAERNLAEIAREVRQVIAVIDGFYAKRRACPQPSRPDELAELQGDLGDGYSVERQGRFTAIRGISTRAAWLYYASTAHPDKCTLWRRIGKNPEPHPALIWRRDGGFKRWSYDPGDGRPERPLKFPAEGQIGDADREGRR